MGDIYSMSGIWFTGRGKHEERGKKGNYIDEQLIIADVGPSVMSV